nr:carbohydrate porin [Novosphingobium taihuense]
MTNVNLTADLDLARLVGLDGTRAHVYVLDNRGGRPNDAAGTLQGVDNVEVPYAGLRLFEAWVERDIGSGGASMRMGLYDVNSEFYANDAAGLLIAPPFGIGSELAATGPNGPSIFPSSALAARLYVPVGAAFVRLGVINARASTLGDRGGVDFSFRDGLLLIGEAGRSEGRLRGNVGVWRYTRNPEDSVETGPDGSPLRKPSQGAYAVVEGDLMPEGAERQVTAFLRAGLSDPHVTPFHGGFQAGVLMAPALASRPDSQVSLGMHHAWTSNHFRDALRAEGGNPGNETVVELTYADQITPWLALQPDVQWIHQPGGDRDAPDGVVGIVRLTLSF